MPRVKRGKIAHKKREKLLRHTKGFKWGRKSKERAAKEALLHAWSHSFRGRKEKKRNFRSAWQTKINAAARENNLTYNKLIALLKKADVKVDRKILSLIAQEHPKTFSKIVAEVSKP